LHNIAISEDHFVIRHDSTKSDKEGEKTRNKAACQSLAKPSSSFFSVLLIDLTSAYPVLHSPISFRFAFGAAITARQQWFRSKLVRIAIAVIDMVGLFVVGGVCSSLFDHVRC
jgi:hypothetical protein